MNNTVEPPAQEIFDLSAVKADCNRKQLLPNEIEGVDTFVITMGLGRSVEFAADALRQTVVFVVAGQGTASVDGTEYRLDALSLFVPRPGTASRYEASESSTLLVIEMALRQEEAGGQADTAYPLYLRYEDCEKYRDYFKSEKTVSRTLVHPYTLPRFCMGSVQTTGPDRIDPHAHPMLDQLFFSFSENKCTLLIDGAEFSFGGDCLLHIPLGSDHGVDAVEGDVVHYLWMDFFPSSKEMEYIVECHKPVEA